MNGSSDMKKMSKSLTNRRSDKQKANCPLISIKGGGIIIHTMVRLYISYFENNVDPDQLASEFIITYQLWYLTLIGRKLANQNNLSTVLK